MIFSDGSEALSEFGKKFMQSLQELQSDSQKRRDDLANDLDLVKKQQEETKEELLKIFPPKSEKEDDPAELYENIINETDDLTLDSDSPQVTGRSTGQRMKGGKHVVPTASEQKNPPVKAIRRVVTESEEDAEVRKSERGKLGRTGSPDLLNMTPQRRTKLPSFRPPIGASDKKRLSTPSMAAKATPSPASSKVPKSNSMNRLMLKPNKDRRASLDNKHTLEQKGSVEMKGSHDSMS